MGRGRRRWRWGRREGEGEGEREEGRDSGYIVMTHEQQLIEKLRVQTYT